MRYLCPLCTKNNARASTTYPSSVVCSCSGKLLEVGVLKNKVYEPLNNPHANQQNLYIFPLRSGDETRLIQDSNAVRYIQARQKEGKACYIITTESNPYQGFLPAHKLMIVGIINDDDIRSWGNGPSYYMGGTMFKDEKQLKEFLKNQGIIS